MGCCCGNCSANFHFQCARLERCVFLLNKETFCQQHTALVGDKVGGASHGAGPVWLLIAKTADSDASFSFIAPSSEET